MAARYFFGIFPPLDDERDAFAEAGGRYQKQYGTPSTLLHPADLHLPLASGPVCLQRDTAFEEGLCNIGGRVRLRPGVIHFNRVVDRVGPPSTRTYDFMAGASPRSVLDAAFLLSQACLDYYGLPAIEWQPRVTWGIETVEKYVPNTLSGLAIVPIEMTLLSVVLAWGPAHGPYVRIAEWAQAMA